MVAKRERIIKVILKREVKGKWRKEGSKEKTERGKGSPNRQNLINARARADTVNESVQYWESRLQDRVKPNTLYELLLALEEQRVQPFSHYC